MKRLFITAIVAVSLTFNANAREVVNQNALQNFETAFGNVSNVKWVSNENYTKAYFIRDEKNFAAFYDRNGELIATTTKIAEEEIPESVKVTFEKKYAGYKIIEALEVIGDDETALFLAVENSKEKIVLKVKKGSFSFYSTL